MKYILCFLILFVFIACDKEHRKPKFNREEMENKVIQCVLDSPEATEEVKDVINKNKDKGYHKVLRAMKVNLPKESRKIVRECRKKVFGDFRKAHRGDL